MIVYSDSEVSIVLEHCMAYNGEVGCVQVHCTLYSVPEHCTLYTVPEHCTVYSLHCMLFSVHVSPEIFIIHYSIKRILYAYDIYTYTYIYIFICIRMCSYGGHSSRHVPKYFHIPILAYSNF